MFRFNSQEDFLKSMGVKDSSKNYNSKAQDCKSSNKHIKHDMLSMQRVFEVNACVYLQKLIDKTKHLSNDNPELKYINELDIRCIRDVLVMCGAILCVDTENAKQLKLTEELVDDTVMSLASSNLVDEINKKYNPCSDKEMNELLEKYSVDTLIKSYIKEIING